MNTNVDIEKTVRNLEARGFSVSRFENRDKACDYLTEAIKDTTVGIGGSKTARELELFDKLSAVGNEVFWHWEKPGMDTLYKENAAEVFISSANAIAETGEILNIDGRGNRLAGLVFGKKRVFIVAGVNKLCPDFESALYRARNVAAVQNATRFPANTPCKIDGKCHDCRAKERICNALLVLWGPMMDMQSVEVVLIDEELGM